MYKRQGQGTAPEAVKGEAGDTVVLPGMSGEGFLGWSTVATANNGGSGNYTQTVYPAGYSYILPEASVTLYAIWVQDYGADATFYIRLDGTIPDEPSGYDSKEYTGGITLSGAIKQGKFVSDTTGAAVLSNLNKTPSTSQIQQVMQAAGKTYDPNTQYIPVSYTHLHGRTGPQRRHRRTGPQRRHGRTGPQGRHGRTGPQRRHRGSRPRGRGRQNAHL